MRAFCKVLVPLHGEPGFVPNFFKDFILTKASKMEPYNYNFGILGYETSYFILNASKKVTLTLAVVILGPIGVVIAIQMKNSSKAILRKLGAKADYKLRWQFFIRALIQSYVSFTVSALLNIVTLSWQNEEDTTANMIACVFMAGLLLMPMAIFTIIYFNSNDLKNQEFQDRYKNLLADVQLDSAMQYQFYVVWFFRRIVFAGIIVLFTFHPIPQFCLMLLHEVAFITYIVISKPYKPGLSK